MRGCDNNDQMHRLDLYIHKVFRRHVLFVNL
jgi:hypothetical protein